MLALEPNGDLVEAFKIRHRLLKSDPDRRFFLTHNVWGALDLDLCPLAEKYARTIQLHYPGTMAIYNGLSDLYKFKREFSNAKELTGVVSKEGIISNESAVMEIAWLEFMQGNTDKALEIFENEFSEFTNDTVQEEDIDESAAERIYYYSEFLRASDQIEKADLYAKKLYSFYTNDIKNDEFLQNFMRYNFAVGCFYVSNRKKEFLDYLEDVFFNKKNRLGWYTKMKSGHYVLFEKDPDYQILFQKRKKLIGCGPKS